VMRIGFRTMGHDMADSDDPELGELAQRFTRRALRHLAWLADAAKSETVRLQASRFLIEFGHGRPAVQKSTPRPRPKKVVYKNAEEFRQALIEKGIPAALLPPSLLPPPPPDLSPEEEAALIKEIDREGQDDSEH
jgi:hypothetical protein